MEPVILKNDLLTVTVTPLGAEIRSVLDRNGRERMWSGDPAVWKGIAPVLFPIAGALKDGYCLYKGKKYTLPTHGFAKDSVFSVLSRSPSSAVFRLDEAYPEYPFDYALFVSYELCADSVRITCTVENNGDEDLLFNLGSHESYSCPDGIDGIRIVFDEKTTLTRAVRRGPLITHDTEPVIENSSVLELNTEGFLKGSYVFQNIVPKALTLVNRQGQKQVRVEYPDFDTLLLWQRPGAGYLCIEPWLNPPEYTDGDHDLIRKPGIRKLSPHSKREYRHSITFYTT